MKTRIFLFLLALFVFFAVAQTATASNSSYTVKEGVYLWNVWLNGNNTVMSWESFCSQVAELNGVPNTAVALSGFQPGQVVRLPEKSQGEAPATEKVRAQLAIARDRIAALEEEKVSLHTDAAQKSDNLYSLYKLSLAVLTFFSVAGILLAFYMFGWLIPKRNLLKDEVESLRRDKLQLFDDARRAHYFLDRYAVPFDVPSDIGTGMGGSQKVYILKAEPLEEKPEYGLFMKDGQMVRVKLSNLLRKFDDASQADLGYYGIQENPNRMKRSRSRLHVVSE